MLRNTFSESFGAFDSWKNGDKLKTWNSAANIELRDWYVAAITQNWEATRSSREINQGMLTNRNGFEPKHQRDSTSKNDVGETQCGCKHQNKTTDWLTFSICRPVWASNIAISALQTWLRFNKDLYCKKALQSQLSLNKDLFSKTVQPSELKLSIPKLQQSKYDAQL